MRSHISVLLAVVFIAYACHRGTTLGTPRHRDGDGALRLVLLQNSYFGGGFDQPLFLAYADGTILFPRTTSHGIPEQYTVLHVPPVSVDSLLGSLGVTAALYSLDSLYDYAPGWTDQHSFYLLLPADSGQKLVVIRAGLEDSMKLRSDVPAPFKQLYARLMAFSPPSATGWVPDSLQVSIWPYEYAPDNPPLAWPQRWPGLDSPRWKRRSDDLVKEVRTIRLPFSDRPLLDSLLVARREKQAIGITGRKWAVGYRWLFPQETEWWWLAKRLES